MSKKKTNNIGKAFHDAACRQLAKEGITKCSYLAVADILGAQSAHYARVAKAGCVTVNTLQKWMAAWEASGRKPIVCVIAATECHIE